MKKSIIGMAALLVLCGCSSGVSQDEYEKVVAERDALQSQVEALNGESLSSGIESDLAIPSDAIITTSAELIDAYDENVVGADNKYKDKTLEVSGKVINVSVDSYRNNAVYVKLGAEGKYDFEFIECYFYDENELAKVSVLKSGDIITVIGVGGGMNGITYSMIEDCRII